MYKNLYKTLFFPLFYINIITKIQYKIKKRPPREHLRKAIREGRGYIREIKKCEARRRNCEVNILTKRIFAFTVTVPMKIAEIQQMRVKLIEFHQISIELLLEGQSFT